MNIRSNFEKFIRTQQSKNPKHEKRLNGHAESTQGHTCFLESRHVFLCICVWGNRACKVILRGITLNNLPSLRFHSSTPLFLLLQFPSILQKCIWHLENPPQQSGTMPHTNIRCSVMAHVTFIKGNMAGGDVNNLYC